MELVFENLYICVGDEVGVGLRMRTGRTDRTEDYWPVELRGVVLFLARESNLDDDYRSNYF